MNRNILIAALMINLGTVGCAKMSHYIEPMLHVQTQLNRLYETPPAAQQPVHAEPAKYETRTAYVNDGPIVLDRINEEAFIEYRDSLKDAVRLISVLSSPQMANPYFVMQIHTQLATSIIEIQQWPADARGTAWRTMGREVESLSKLFESHRGRLVEDERYSADFRSALRQIALLTRD